MKTRKNISFLLTLVMIVACFSGFVAMPNVEAAMPGLTVDEIGELANELSNDPRAIEVIEMANAYVKAIESAGRQDFDQNYPKLLSYKMQLINNNASIAGIQLDQFEDAYQKSLEFGSVVDQWNAHVSAVTFYEFTSNSQEEIKVLEIMIGMIDDGTWSREVNPYMNPESERAIWQKALDVTRGELGDITPPTTEPTITPPTIKPSSSPTVAPTTESGATKPTKLTVKKKLTIRVGKKKTLKAKLSPMKISKAQAKLTWKSSNKKIATVNKKGVVRAKKKGSCKITVRTVNGKKAVCRVKVRK